MEDLEKYYRALAEADAAGDIESAQALANYIRELRALDSQQPEQSQQPQVQAGDVGSQMQSTIPRLAAGAASLGNSLLFGVPEMIAPETFREMREYNPGAVSTGETLSYVVPVAGGALGGAKLAGGLTKRLLDREKRRAIDQSLANSRRATGTLPGQATPTQGIKTAIGVGSAAQDVSQYLVPKAAGALGIPVGGATAAGLYGTAQGGPVEGTTAALTTWDLLTNPLQTIRTGLGALPAIISGGIEQRQFGGPIAPNKPYLVGERGPELIVPQQQGFVLPNPATLGEIQPVDYSLTAGMPDPRLPAIDPTPEAIAAAQQPQPQQQLTDPKDPGWDKLGQGDFSGFLKDRLLTPRRTAILKLLGLPI